MRRRLSAITLALLCVVTLAQAQTLPVPERLVAFPTEAGQALLLHSDANAAYFPLAAQFVTQENQAFCGVASLTMVLNALGLPAPETPAFAPYRAFTQANILDASTEAIVPRETILARGLTLDQLGRLASRWPLAVSVRHAADVTVDRFRDEARAALAAKGRFVVVNYLRKAIDEERGGHISPLGAYDADTDRFLILDVARYKYPPVWVTAADLFGAMNTPDADNDDRSRGYVLIGSVP